MLMAHTCIPYKVLISFLSVSSIHPAAVLDIHFRISRACLKWKSQSLSSNLGLSRVFCLTEWLHLYPVIQVKDLGVILGISLSLTHCIETVTKSNGFFSHLHHCFSPDFDQFPTQMTKMIPYRVYPQMLSLSTHSLISVF